MPYDSEHDTREHIDKVGIYLNMFMNGLNLRAQTHDYSKLSTPEKEIFDEFTPKIKDSTYGSAEYKRFLDDMGEALNHHYENNRHHPEHFPNGMAGMNLIDLVEMFCDWLAATKRHADGDIFRSIEQNQERFGYPDMLKEIFINTAKCLETWG